ncbi:hypothetical protein Pmar_PMAR011754 [Perkinsus marinus ATCC 50983]|uniref:Uncharacterized protein n=1 Tax=Perkinsus marinus (strain ATCC 50983 / TXsc) TaxID=423536 RepID=C5LCM5_PERM5|nr:hypothetical protein Pmar_PMAR011754 [Perkinsus marinus ATCC 50983]EER05708.1 hypothetical protein Pmar_PMAR011754 [Perkinsus marinus ATCC 50983]|eukprot:XP_002773892.1 hypothetical protein Pmar_PMAR011754 [Perkinsus marinus ATCC 50983]
MPSMPIGVTGTNTTGVGHGLQKPSTQGPLSLDHYQSEGHDAVTRYPWANNNIEPSTWCKLIKGTQPPAKCYLDYEKHLERLQCQLRSLYDDEDCIAKAKVSFFMCEQGTSESLSDYVKRLESTVTELHLMGIMTYEYDMKRRLYDGLQADYLRDKVDKESSDSTITFDKFVRLLTGYERPRLGRVRRQKVNTVVGDVDDDSSFDAHVYAVGADSMSIQFYRCTGVGHPARLCRGKRCRKRGHLLVESKKKPVKDEPSTPTPSAKVTNPKTRAHLVSLFTLRHLTDKELRFDDPSALGHISVANGSTLSVLGNVELEVGYGSTFVKDSFLLASNGLNLLDGCLSVKEMDWARKVMVMQVSHYSKVVPCLRDLTVKSSLTIESLARANSLSGPIGLYQDLYHDAKIYPTDDTSIGMDDTLLVDESDRESWAYDSNAPLGRDHTKVPWRDDSRPEYDFYYAAKRGLASIAKLDKERHSMFEGALSQLIDKGFSSIVCDVMLVNCDCLDLPNISGLDLFDVEKEKLRLLLEFVDTTRGQQEKVKVTVQEYVDSWKLKQAALRENSIKDTSQDYQLALYDLVYISECADHSLAGHLSLKLRGPLTVAKLCGTSMVHLFDGIVLPSDYGGNLKVSDDGTTLEGGPGVSSLIYASVKNLVPARALQSPIYEKA